MPVSQSWTMATSMISALIYLAGLLAREPIMNAETMAEMAFLLQFFRIPRKFKST
jgi:hypothetical protein